MIHHRPLAWLLLPLFLLLVGCPAVAPKNGPPQDRVPKKSSVTLRIAVEDEPDLERAILRLRGEWTERTGGDLEIIAFTPETDADLLVFASRKLGELCEQGELRPIRQSVLKSDTLRWDDYLPLVRQHEIVYGNRVMALPLGCPSPLLAVTTEEGPLRLVLPEDAHALALVYLAWAAPQVAHPSREAVLFDQEGLRPRLTEPPFVRALEQLIETSTSNRDANARFVWPQRTSTEDSQPVARVLAPPEASEHYNPLADTWEPLHGGQRSATLLASSGQLLGVTSSSRNAAIAFRFAKWLASPENCRLLATASNRVANPRGSFARAPDDWLGTGDREIGRRFAETSADALRQSRYLMVPRIPAGDRYLLALGEAVQRALQGESPPAALKEATKAWEAITVEQGRSKQLAAYLRSVGARDYKP